MKVLFQTRFNLFTRKGGDTVQIVKTKEFIEQKYPDIRIDINSDPSVDVSGYDLIHIFNLLRPQETSLFVQNAKAQNKKTVLSTIYWRSPEFEKQGQFGLRRMINRLIDYDGMEKIRALYRYYLDGEKHEGTKQLIRRGYTRLQRDILDQVDLLLPNGEGEIELIQNVLKPGKPIRYLVVPNAIDAGLFWCEPLPDRDLVLCVGRFEPRKNQLNLIKAFRGLPYKLVLAGTAHRTQQKYFDAMKKAIGNSNVQIVPEMEHDDLKAWYRRAKVHVLPSWYDTPGLVSLEAAVSGCNIVATTRGTTREYFRDDAFYCEPGSVESIQRAVMQAFQSPGNEQLQRRIAAHYTWEKAAEKTVEGYRQLLG
ncbi:glycosyltransferase [Paenibacillus sp. S28]|uniref:glycosyltransferase n=1 Tax=Paenibacillus sp. S28 TaxID=2767463 RepID=UPI0019092E3A|nr:glycosyltransferase [Paenibacillus sp. S28]MBJ9991094.1 glycosyltransferase [Paenibacillus sp. S28]